MSTPCICGAAPAAFVVECGMVVCTECGQVVDEGVMEDPTGTTAYTGLQSSSSVASRFHTGTNWRKVDARVRGLAAELRLSKHAVAVAQAVCRKALGAPSSGVRLECYAACSILLAVRRDPSCAILTIGEVASRVHCSPVLVGRCWRQLIAQLVLERAKAAADPPHAADSAVDAEDDAADAAPSHLNTAALVDRHCEVLRRAVLSSSGQRDAAAAKRCAALLTGAGRIRETALALLDIARDEWLLEGRSPLHMTVAVVLLAARAHAAEAAPLLKLQLEPLLCLKPQQAVVRKRLGELKEVVLRMARQLPGRATLPESTLVRGLPGALREFKLQRVADMQTIDFVEEEAKADTARQTTGAEELPEVCGAAADVHGTGSYAQLVASAPRPECSHAQEQLTDAVHVLLQRRALPVASSVSAATGAVEVHAESACEARGREAPQSDAQLFSQQRPSPEQRQQHIGAPPGAAGLAREHDGECGAGDGDSGVSQTVGQSSALQPVHSDRNAPRSFPPAYIRAAKQRACRTAKVTAAQRRIAARALPPDPHGTPEGTAQPDAHELDAEDMLIERALLRGAPEHAVAQGYYDASSLREDRELVREDAPHLFSEELTESDLPSELVHARHFRTAAEVKAWQEASDAAANGARPTGKPSLRLPKVARHS